MEDIVREFVEQMRYLMHLSRLKELSRHKKAEWLPQTLEEGVYEMYLAV